VARHQLSFLLSRRWIGFALAVLVLAAICTRMGFWQLQKLDDRLASNEVVQRHLAADPVPLDDALEDRRSVTKDMEWTPVRVTGTYDVEHELTVKFTTRDSAPGVDVVTPLVQPDGTAVLVNRGWKQTLNTTQERPDVPAPPSGTVTVTGWLRPDSGQVRAISSKALASFVPYDLEPGFINLRVQEPPAGDELALEPEPELGQGPHFFYALQWWFFGLLAIVGWFWFARVELRERRAGQASETRSA
jgi:cytochrome oxidase assembly protein ShyY1